MMQTAIDYKSLKFTKYSELFSWDVKYFLNQNETFNKKYPLVLFGYFLKKPIIDKIQIEDDKTYNILGVRSYGKGVFSNRIVKGNTLKMREYYKAKPNHLFWCKVDTKNGAFGVIKDDLADGLGSSNMTFAEIDTKKINLDFLQLLFTSKGVMSYLDGYVTGTTNRKYIRPDQLLNEITIPLPTLTEQEVIVNSYQSKIQEAQKLEQQAQDLETEIERYLYDSLGYQHEKEIVKINAGRYISIVNYLNLNKWGVDKNESTNLKTKYYFVSIEELCSVSSGGTPSRTRKDYYNGHIPWIKTGEVVNDVIIDTEEKITLEAINNSSAKVYPKNSLIIAMYGQGLTRGRTAKLGIDASTNQACAVLYNINENIVFTDYLWVYLMGEYERLRSLASGNNQPNLNAQMIKNYNVVIPPLQLQKEIAKNYFNLKDQVKSFQKDSETLIHQAEQEFEKSIFS